MSSDFIDFCEKLKAEDCSFKKPVKDFLWLNFEGDAYIVGNSHWGGDYYVFFISKDNINDKTLKEINKRIDRYLEKGKLYYGVGEASQSHLKIIGFEPTEIDVKSISENSIKEIHSAFLKKGNGVFNSNARHRKQKKQGIQKRINDYNDYMSKVR